MVDFTWEWHDEEEISRLSRIDATRLRESFEEYLEERREMFPEIEYYAEHGTWRNTEPLTDGEAEQVDRIAHNQAPRQCYYNAQTAIVPDVTYVEGYTAGRHSTVPHAWLEINGKVAEITPSINRQRQEYFGTEFEQDVVLEAMLDRETAEPMVEWVI